MANHRDFKPANSRELVYPAAFGNSNTDCVKKEIQYLVLEAVIYTLKREDKLPVDSWLRNLTRNGMKPMKVDEEAMTVKSSLEALSIYKETYNVSMWNEICPSVWECGEVGSWFIDAKNNTAVYIESNLWGIAWKKTGLK